MELGLVILENVRLVHNHHVPLDRPESILRAGAAQRHTFSPVDGERSSDRCVLRDEGDAGGF